MHCKGNTLVSVLFLLPLGFSCLYSCSVVHPVPQARVRKGPSFEKAPRKILALPTTCVGETSTYCVSEYLAAIASITRMTLEYEGRRVLDSEGIKSEATERTEKRQQHTRTTSPRDLHLRGAGTPYGSTGHVVLTQSGGTFFLAASPETQRSMAAQMGIDGVFLSEMRVGQRQNISDQRTIEVRLALLRVPTDKSPMSLVWSSKCSAETGVYLELEQAIDTATRCALDSVGFLGQHRETP